MENLIEIKNISKVYRMGQEKIIALNGINLNIANGEICCLLGTSGSGKSTLLNLIAGLEKPTNGTITINGKSIHNMSERNLAKFRQVNIGFVFQSYNLLSTLTALENVAMPLIFNKVPRSIRNKRALKMLKSVGLGNRVRHRPSEMSGGQQQRVSLARAFINNPRIVFADEPTGNLDTKTTQEMMDLIVGMVRKNKQTLILVTHDMGIAHYADRIIRISDGKIVDIEQVTPKQDSSESILA